MKRLTDALHPHDGPTDRALSYTGAAYLSCNGRPGEPDQHIWSCPGSRGLDDDLDGPLPDDKPVRKAKPLVAETHARRPAP